MSGVMYGYARVSTRGQKEDRQMAALQEFGVAAEHITVEKQSYYQFVNAKTEEEFQYFLSNVKSLSLYDTGVEAKYGDTFITLSTCDYEEEDGRFVVVARKIEKANSKK